MGLYDPTPSYDGMLTVFKRSLGHVLAGQLPPHDSSIFDVPLMLALLDIANAARQSRPTESLVTRATEAFAMFAANFTAAGAKSARTDPSVYLGVRLSA